MAVIVLSTLNYFDEGWLAAFMGMSKAPPEDLKGENLAAWNDGYDMQKETGDDNLCLQAFRKMVAQRQISIGWEE